ncbi:hypothetical protein JXA47_14010 [Candidatus Sumerlaeota bacterium]|nr:hypothetical protein [Candidatus Sumerlaeota bacterium]
MIQNAAHLHLLLNHLPPVGVLIGFCLLIAGMIARSRALRAGALGIFIACGVLVIPTNLSGEEAEHVVEGLPGVTEGWIEHHEEMAEVALILTIVLAIASVATLIAEAKSPRVTKPMLAAVLIIAFVDVGVLMITAHRGGLIRHTEIRGDTAVAQELGHD